MANPFDHDHEVDNPAHLTVRRYKHAVYGVFQHVVDTRGIKVCDGRHRFGPMRHRIVWEGKKRASPWTHGSCVSTLKVNDRIKAVASLTPPDPNWQSGNMIQSEPLDVGIHFRVTLSEIL